MFYVGQKVTLSPEAGTAGLEDYEKPVEGEVYTVIQIKPAIGYEEQNLITLGEFNQEYVAEAFLGIN